MVTLSNVEAVFDNSSTFYVRVAGRDEVDLFNVSAGTTLRVTPHVFRDQRQPRASSCWSTSRTAALTSRQVDQIPVVERSTINTQALIGEGESLLIGGMVREATLGSVDKVPGLGDVPVVGNLFKTRSNSSVARRAHVPDHAAAGRPRGRRRRTCRAAHRAAPAAPRGTGGRDRARRVDPLRRCAAAGAGAGAYAPPARPRSCSTSTRRLPAPPAVAAPATACASRRRRHTTRRHDTPRHGA